MAELGANSAAAHAAIGRLADDLDIEVVAVACLDYGADVDVPDVEAAVEAVGALGVGDAVLVKASRSADLQTVAERLVGGH